MTTLEEWISTLAPVGVALGVVAKLVWTFVTGRIDRAEARYEARVVALEKRVQELEKERDTIRDELTERWIREVRRGAALAASYSTREAAMPPESLPVPDWRENTEIRNVRALVEREELLKAYTTASDRPPPARGRMPSRPR